MSWQRKLPSLTKLRNLQLTTTDFAPSPMVLSMPRQEYETQRFFVIVEFQNDIIVETFNEAEEAASWASAVFLALDIM
jgi:hypothetical protein